MKDSISFIIPAYNVKKYLTQCVQSLLKVMQSNDEILIINDGSTDTTLKIAKELAADDGRITVINQKNQGVSIARNVGIEKAKRDYIMFVDADDLLNKSFKNTKRAFDGADIVYFAKEIDKKAKKNDILLNLACVNKPCIPWPFSKAFNRNFLINNSIRYPKGIINGEDILFNISALILATSYKIVNKSFYLYRITKGTATKRFDAKIIESDKKFHTIMDDICSKYKSEHKKTIEQIKALNQSQAILTILSRFSYIDSYKKAAPLYCQLEDEPYKTILHIPTNLKQKIIFRLCRQKKYRILYILFRLKRQNHSKNEYFKEI